MGDKDDIVIPLLIFPYEPDSDLDLDLVFGVEDDIVSCLQYC